MEDEFICSANAEVRCVFLTSRSSWLEWYAQRPAYRGLRSCSTINMFIYFTSLEYLEKQTKLEEEEVRTEKAGKQFHLKTTGATKKNPDSLCQWVCGNLIYCIMSADRLKHYLNLLFWEALSSWGPCLWKGAQCQTPSLYILLTWWILINKIA